MLKIGDLVLFKPDTMLGHIISKVTKSDYSHIGIIYGKIKGETMIFHMDYHYRLEPLRIIDREYDVFRVDSLNVTLRNKLQSEIIDIFMNTDYDYLQLVSYLNRFLLGVDKVYNNPNKHICSESIDILFHRLCIDLVKERPQGDATPEDIIRPDFVQKIHID